MRNRISVVFFLLVLMIAGTGIAFTRSQWVHLFIGSNPDDVSNADSTERHSHSEPSKGLVLSDDSKAGLGLQLEPVRLRDYWRSIPIPAEVMEEPGHCEQGVSSTVHGIILKIHAFHGQTVRTGDPLFDIRPTSELLASTQTALLKSIQEIEIVQAELKRITSVNESGGIPGKNKIEKESELKRLETQRLLQMQELVVRGLLPVQVAEIVRSKTLIQELTIRVPGGQVGSDTKSHIGPIHEDGGNDDKEHEEGGHGEELRDPTTKDSPAISTQHEHGSVYSIEQLNVHLGKLVQPGEELCHLARHSQLLIAGRAFERESFLVTQAIERNWPVKAVFDVADESPVVREGLSILYADNVIEQDSRTLRFYIPLPNELVRDQPSTNGLSYRSWRFKPGQRARVLLPVEHLMKQMVIPAEAIVKEGSEAFVFRANGRMLEQISVRLAHLDSRDALIRQGGSLAPGDIVAQNQAFQLYLAIKNSQGSQGSSHEGHDHAGHDHAGHEH